MSKKPVCRFCKSRNFSQIYNPVEDKVQVFCDFCDAWTSLVYAEPKQMKTGTQKRYFYSRPPIFRGASEVDIIRRSTLPHSVKSWALYRSSQESDNDHMDIKAICAHSVKTSLNPTIIERAAKSIQRCSESHLKSIDVCIYQIILSVLETSRLGKPPRVAVIARNLGINEQTLYSRRRWTKKGGAATGSDYKPPLFKLIDAIEQIAAGYELSWQLGTLKKTA